ncbi:MAG: hypothetical protein V1789_12375 [PVC group bacterium]
MKKIMAVIILSSLIVGVSSVSAEDIVLWGKQTRGWGATNAKTESKAITLERQPRSSKSRELPRDTASGPAADRSSAAAREEKA